MLRTVERRPRPPAAARDSARAGKRLSTSEQAWATSAFGFDFSNVRIHQDARAAEATAQRGAMAMTRGQDIFAARGALDFDSTAGRQRLAHELTHVVQQAHHTVDANRLEPAGSPAEREAHEVSARVARGDAAPAVHQVPTGLPRDVGFASRGPIPDAYGLGYNEIFRRAGAGAEQAVRDLAGCETASMGFDRARFQALPAARRAAVLALAPHATGTGCEPWFVELSHAAIPTSGGGVFTVNTYAPHQSAAGDVDKDVGAEIGLTFTPAPTLRSSKISFVQVLRPIVLFPNEQGRATQASDGEAGWAVDRLQGRRSANYGENNDGTAAGNTHFGYRRSLTDMDPAWMYDRTNEPRAAHQALSLTGTTFALDAQHGTYVGGVRWGFRVDAAGNVTTLPLSLEAGAGPTGPQHRALELWNQQAADPDPARRNDPNQQRVPL